MESTELYQQISAIVDKWVSEVLRDRFMQKPQGVPPRSLWDKFKQGLTNWWWGPKGEKHNPYRWRNRFGDELGVAESFNPSIFTLHEYKEIRSLIDSLENRLVEENDEFGNLRLMKIIQSAAEALKKRLFDFLSPKIQGVADRSPSASSSPDGQRREVKKVADPKASKPQPTVAPGGGDREAAPDEKSLLKGSVGAVAKMKEGGTLRPDDNWFEGGKVKKEKILHLVAWMSLKTHIDNPLSAEKAIEELSRAFPERKIKLGVPGKGDGRVESYLRSVLGDEYEKAMSKIGVEVSSSKNSESAGAGNSSVSSSSAGSSAPSSTEKSSGVVGSRPGGSAETEGENENKTGGVSAPSSTAEPSSGNENPELEGYVEKSKEKIISFLRALGGILAGGGEEDGAEKKSKLYSWWKEEQNNIKTLSSLKEKLVAKSEYLAAISKATGISVEKVKEMMVDHLRGKQPSQGQSSKESQKKNEDEEEDRDLGLDAYLYDGDKQLSHEESIRRLEKFVTNPLQAALGVKLDDERAARLAGWWQEEKKTIDQKSDRQGYLRDALLGSGDDSHYIKKISEILGKSESLIKGIMEKHIRAKKNRT